MHYEKTRHPVSDDRPGVGLILAGIQIAAYFLFVYCCAFQASALRADFLGSGVPLSFVAGIAVIILGIVLTGLYVFACRTREHS